MPVPSTPSKEQRLSSRERVYQTLRAWIIDGTLEPDEKIADMEIAKYFNVSRTPVREAIQLLADQHLVNISPGRESRIAPIQYEQAEQFYTMMAELQALAVEFAFPKITAQVLEKLEKLNASLSVSEADLPSDPITEWDRSFHNAFFELADNDFLRQFCDTLYIHIKRIEYLYYERHSDGQVSQKEHQRIIDALKAGDREEAKAAMRENWLSTLRSLT